MEIAAFERAKCIAMAGDMNTGINELRKFTNDPLRQSSVAPQAILQLATYLRMQNKLPDAVEVFAKNREPLEGPLSKAGDKGAAMLALLRYHHGVALREDTMLAALTAWPRAFDDVTGVGFVDAARRVREARR